VRIKNLDNASTSGPYTISYQINDGAIITEQSNITIPASGTINYLFATTADLSSVDSFYIKVIVKQSGDLRPENDEQTYLIRHLDNQPITLPYVDNFENTKKQEYRSAQFGLENIERFDFTLNSTNGRLRTFVNTGMALEGDRAITLDAPQYIGNLNTNQFIGTYNLSGQLLTPGLRFDFLYKNQGQLNLPDATVFVRGKDDLPWIKAFDFKNGQYQLDQIRRGWINLYSVLSNEGQDVSSSFQVLIQQAGRSSSNNAEYSPEAFDFDDGVTIDNLRISVANNDLHLVGVSSPDSLQCSNSINQKLVSVRVRNTTSTPISNTPVYYKLNNNTPVSEIIPLIPGNTEVSYTFSTPVQLNAFGVKYVDAWVALPADNYPYNDTINNYPLFQAAVVQSFPYLEKFETNDGTWFTTSPYSSWAWGSTDLNTRAVLKNAANGNKAWFSSLAWSYKSNELSYLYSPCFNISSLTSPVLSFSHIYQMETGMDFHTLEYSINNGATWQRLGLQNNGTNWFDTTNLVWRNNIQRWHVSSTDLPPGLTNIRFRFLMSSDDFIQGEGIGIDDFHIFEKKTIYEGTNTAVTLPVSGNNFIDFSNQDKIIASIHPLGQNLGNVKVDVFINADSVRLINNQYYLDRNLVITPQFNPADSVIVRFYFTENEIKKMISTTKCSSCLKLTDAYKASVTKYSGSSAFENGILNDGSGGVYQYTDDAQIEIVPYNNGYYAEFKAKSFSEFWIHALDLNLIQNPASVNNISGSKSFITSTLFDPSGRLMIYPAQQAGIQEMQVRLIGANGQEIFNTNAPYQQSSFNMNYLSDGVYIIYIKDRSGKYTYRSKLVKD